MLTIKYVAPVHRAPHDFFGAMRMENTGRYQAYLLRLWAVEQNGQVAWRASLESAQTGERIGFPTLDALFDYVRIKIGGDSSLCSNGDVDGKDER